MNMWITILSSFMLACACGNYAKSKGKNPTYWFVAGALFGLFALLALFFVSRQRSSVKRVKVPPATPFEPRVPSQKEKFWYVLDEDKKQLGPMSFIALKGAWEKGSVKMATFVWNEEMEEWKPLQEVVQL